MLAAAIILSTLALCIVGALVLCALPTRRERLAAAALTGLLADHLDHADECREGETCEQAVARLAVAHADAVIAELDMRDVPPPEEEP